MENFANIRENINSSMVRLKVEWNGTRSIWKDAKAKEYERLYLVPIVTKQSSILDDIQTLEKISDQLSRLGVDV